MNVDFQGGQYGTVCRVGLIVPSLNVVIEPEFNLLKFNDVSIHSTRMLLSGTMTRESYSRMTQDAAVAAALLHTARVDVIAYACTSGSILNDGDKITETLVREGRAPAVTTSRAFVEALHALHLRRIAVGTPYVEFVNEGERKFLEELGFEVTAIHGLEMGRTPESRIAIGRQGWEVAYELAKRIDSPDAEGIFLSCTNFATIGILEKLEQELGKPVISSNVATFWAAMSRAQIQRPVRGFGSLLDKFPPLPEPSRITLTQ